MIGVELSADDLIDLIEGVHGLQEDQQAALRARLKHFHRERFPWAEGPQRGSRVTYRVIDALKILVAFALLETGLPSVRAAGLVDAGWDLVGPALTAAWADRGRKRAKVPLIVVEPRTLVSMGRIGLDRQASAEKLLVVSRAAATDASGARATLVLVDPWVIARRIAEALARKPEVLQAVDEFLRPT